MAAASLTPEEQGIQLAKNYINGTETAEGFIKKFEKLHQGELTCKDYLQASQNADNLPRLQALCVQISEAMNLRKSGACTPLSIAEELKLDKVMEAILQSKRTQMTPFATVTAAAAAADATVPAAAGTK